MSSGIIVISGPSGSGKTTLYKRLLKDYPDSLAFSISATTRKPRPGEKDGTDYYFISKEEFESRIANNEFVEYNKYAGNYYGTLLSEIERINNLGDICLLDIEVNGARNVKKTFPSAMMVFIMPPSIEEMKKRILNRGRMDETELDKRLKTAEEEMEHAPMYDRIIVNDKLEKAYEELKGIIEGLL